MNDQHQARADSSTRKDDVADEKSVSRAAIASFAMPVLAFLLPALPEFGSEIIIFTLFTALTRIGCAATGVILGIVGCVYGGSGKNFILGLAGVALNVLTFLVAVVLATK